MAENKLVLPTRSQRKFLENRGTYADVQVEDRPYRIAEHQFNERRGIYEDVMVPLSDYEILEAGGIEKFFNKDGSRKGGEKVWPELPGEAEVEAEEDDGVDVPTMSNTKAEIEQFIAEHDIDVGEASTKAELIEAIDAVVE